jgi:hypothetical protein
MTPTPVKHYSVGFLMNEQPATGLALVRLPGYAFLNGISRLVEPGETPEQRIVRASLQSFGVTPASWTPFTTLRGPGQSEFLVFHYFYARDTKTLGDIRQIGKDEPVKLYVAELQKHQTLPNIQWLVPMALAMTEQPTTSLIINQQIQTATAADLTQRATWQQTDPTTYKLIYQTRELGKILHQPDAELAKKYLWSAQVREENRLDSLNTTMSYAPSLTEACYAIETILVTTQTLTWPQLPIESNLHFIEPTNSLPSTQARRRRE